MERNKKKLKILIPILTIGNQGGFRVLAQLANYWSDMGHEVAVVAYYNNNNPYFPIKSNIIWIDDKGYKIRENIDLSNLKNGIFNRIKSLSKFLKKNSIYYDIVLANHNLSAWPIALASKSHNFYYIQAYEPEFYTDSGYKSFIQSLIAKISYYLPLKRIVNADIYKKYKGLRADLVIPPGLDLKVYYPKILSNNKNKEFVIGCIGRIEEWKGSKDVTDAVKILHEKGYKIKFKVAFNQVNYDRYEFVKPDGDENLADFYRSLDILVAPGHIQLGAVHYPVIEAMACKIPVITTGYYPANNENAYIVSIKSPISIADTIIDIMDDYQKAIEKAEKAYKTITQFDWVNVSAKFIEMFNSELEGVQK